jgi:DNA-binding LacI/PurR family transcriptional regulator
MFKRITSSIDLSFKSAKDIRYFLIGDLDSDYHKNYVTGIICISNDVALDLREMLAEKDLHPIIISMNNSPLARWANLPALAFDGYQLVS